MSETRRITTINHRGHVRPVENTMGDANPRPKYLTALAPPNNSLLPTGEPSGVPLPSEPTDDPQTLMIALADVSLQLAEAKAALADVVKADAAIRKALNEEVARLQAALDRERENKKGALDAANAWMARYETEREARLRAEAGAAVMRQMVLDLRSEIAQAQMHFDEHDSIPTADLNAATKRAGEVLSTDTGAALAAVLEDVRKMPCQKDFRNGLDCIANHNYDPCLRCRLVDASSNHP